MFAATMNPEFPSAEDLAIRLAQSRVGLAALRLKHAKEQGNDDDIAHAALLREYYSTQLLASEPATLNAETIPREDIRNILQSVIANYDSAPSPVEEPARIAKMIALLDQLISRNITSADAAGLIELLNRASPQVKASYAIDELKGSGDEP